MARVTAADGTKRGAVAVKDGNGVYRTRTQIKYCKACGRYHPIEAFRKEPKRLDGLSANCAVEHRRREAKYRVTKETPEQWNREADRQYEYRWDNRAYYKMYTRYRYIKKQIAEIDRDESKWGVRGGAGFVRSALVKEMRQIRRDIGTPTNARKSRLR